MVIIAVNYYNGEGMKVELPREEAISVIAEAIASRTDFTDHLEQLRFFSDDALQQPLDSDTLDEVQRLLDLPH
jgi:hypothetical protein